jgi:hypothetical protein
MERDVHFQRPLYIFFRVPSKEALSSRSIAPRKRDALVREHSYISLRFRCKRVPYWIPNGDNIETDARFYSIYIYRSVLERSSTLSDA